MISTSTSDRFEQPEQQQRSRIVVHGSRQPYAMVELPQLALENHFLVRELVKQTPFFNLNLPLCSRRTILRKYDEALTLLGQYKGQVYGFKRTMFEQSFDVSVPYLRQENVYRAMREVLTEFYEFRFSTLPSIKTPELLLAPEQELYALLAQHHHRALRQFVGELVVLFESMQAREFVGKAAYFGQSDEVCRYTYFRCRALANYENPIEHVTTTDEEFTRVKSFRGEEFELPQWIRRKYVTRRILRSGKFVIQHVTHEHLLSSVKKTPLIRWTLPLPNRIHPIVNAIPTFLRPHATIVVGDVEKARVIAKDVAEHPWFYTKARSFVEEHRHYDPMISIGPAGWIVAGWCHLEHPRTSLYQQMRGAFLRSITPQTFDLQKRF